MSLLTEPGFGLKFNGISDSVLVPVNSKKIHGIQDEGRQALPAALNAFTLETWFIPDCGGVVFEQENVMRLTVGSPSSPAPATFEVRLQNPASGREAVYSLSTAKPVTKANGRVAYWDGVLYPAVNEVHDSYLATDAGKDDVTAFNSGHRELLNVTVMFDRRVISLFVNGDLAVSQTLEEPHELVTQQNHIYLGGRGGDFRGTLESIHWSKGALPSGYQQYAPVKSDNTLGLWRFEEPIEPISLITTTPSISASTGVSSTINIGATAAQALVDELTGQSGLTSADFTTSPWSAGAYSVTVHAVSSTSTATIPKVPYNILVNPLGFSQTTGKPTNKAPERMRLMSVDASAGTIVVESIHLDFEANASTGRRGALMAHDAGRFVIITGDCIVDTGKGNEFQPYGSGTQFSQRQGQVCIDESDYENHGVVFSQSMAVDSHEYNKFSASTTNMGSDLLAGHCGRHALNHVTSHSFMGLLPPTSQHSVDKKLDMSSDIITAVFPSQFSEIRSTVPINSIISSYDIHSPIKVQSVTSSSVVSSLVENGMSDIADSKRELLAIGGEGFNPVPFLLKSVPSHEETSNTRHAIPSTESRIATLSLPALSAYGYAPFVQLHYNALDYEGTEFSVGATSRLTGNISGSNKVLTLQSIKSFGHDGQTILGMDIRIGNTSATTNSQVFATINYSAKTLTFSAAVASAFATAATTGAIVQKVDLSPKLLVEKSLPSVSTILTGSYSILDLIHDSMAINPLTVFSPGGVIDFETPSMLGLSDGDLEGDNAEGLVAEKLLNLDLCPENYLPLTSTDPTSTTPQAIALATSELSTRKSVFHRVLVRSNKSEVADVEELAGATTQLAFNGNRPRTGILVNNGSGYAASTTGAMTVDGADATTFFEAGDRLYKADGTDLGAITAVTTTSVTVGGGTTAAVVDNDELFNQPQVFGLGTTNQSTCVNEYFDIIEHTSVSGITSLVVQPSDRNRLNILSKMSDSSDRANFISIESLVAKGRVLSFADGTDGNSVLTAHGISSDLASSSVYIKGSAAPDSHIVKEIMPGAPVVTMTLGGVGQGAINTKETYDPSPLARLAWNTRHDCQTRVDSTTSTTVVVSPLNNRATDLQSWGTYCFPKVGTVYLEVVSNEGESIKFAKAEYTSKTGDTFTFASGTGHEGTGKFVLADGTEADSLAAWITATGITAGRVLHVDDKFSQETMCNDGTTINDRLFQTLDTVQHDYQLGTQYASTRALVEIPLFHDQFFNDLVGPDNAMKIHIDATHTAHSWAPSPVGRRVSSVSPQDPEIFGPFSYAIQNDTHRSGTKVTQPYTTSGHKIYVEDASLFPIPSAPPVSVAGLGGSARYRRAFLASGEWIIYSARDTTNNFLTVAGSAGDDFITSENFFRDLKVGAFILPTSGYQDMNYSGIADNPSLISAGYENRRSFYFDRSNVMTQGGNTDYGLKQYVSAIELRAGPRNNPHLPKIKSKRPRAKVVSVTGSPATSITLDDASLFPKDSPDSDYKFRVAWRNASGTVFRGFYTGRTSNTLTISSSDSGFTPSVGDEVYIEDLHATASGTFPKVKETFLNRAWAHPFCVGGLRQGDTVWMNMHYTNPHAIEGMFCKSRGTLNEAEVWKGFNGGVGSFNASPRDSIPMENFLIGDSCIETAQNLVQHINKTVEVNYDTLGLDETPPVVAYLDPYQCTEGFVRVLLYDVENDREFIAFQDIHMQVQSSPAAATIGNQSGLKTGVIDNSTDSGSPLDVAAGFLSQNKNLNTTVKSDFIESAYAHSSSHNQSVAGGISKHHVGGVDNTATDGYSTRTNHAVAIGRDALIKHQEIEASTRERSTFFDTPDGTRIIPAFLAMKGIRNSTLALDDARMKNLDHWTKMDFVRRLTVDLGEVAIREGVDNIESAAREVVRLINQAGAKNGKTHARRPNDQFLGKNDNFDPATVHQKADFAATASTHDPAPFWEVKKAFASHDRGTHMGYVRAHLGRVVEGTSAGYSIIIHSTIPGASGRNFCAWLDASRAQMPYRPQYLIGHGGRFRNYWCQPDEISGENMHPAPMPINRFGRPFAPITTLKEYLPPENVDDEVTNNINFGADTVDSNGNMSFANRELASGRISNTLLNESFETKSPASVLVDGLRVGTKAKSRINFGGMTMAGIPGWSPDLSKWGYTNDGTANATRYGNASNAADLMTLTTESSDDGYIPKADMLAENIGNRPLYGLRFEDHRGNNHTIRLLYKQFGKSFSGENTYLPPTLDEEVIVHFDDRDVGQGGFTIGRHIVGTGEVCGEKTGGSAKKFKGNLWNTYPSPIVGVKVATSLSSGTMTMTLDAPYDTSAPAVMQSHPDILGYLGLPKSGMFQLSKHGTGGSDHQGLTFYYTSRTHNNYSGTHKFFGVIGGSSSHSNGDWFMSPRINFTSLLTDEVIAAAVAHAINTEDSTQDNIDATSFDCTDMFAPDGRTLGEWGVSPTAIRIKVRADAKVPLSRLFEANVAKDFGLLDGVSTEAVDSGTHLQGLADGDKDDGVRLDIGYIPKTVLHISTKYRGTNANTATPVLVDSQNNTVDIIDWQKNLRGENFTDIAGDHIIPRVDSPCVEVHSFSDPDISVATNESWALLGKPASDTANSWGEPFIVWHSSNAWARVRSKAGVADPEEVVTIESKSTNPVAFPNPAGGDILWKRNSTYRDFSQIDGVRIAGSKNSSPFLYFRGGRDSPDHYVPLYFGGGFSGVVTDINDGTQNDYSDFYTHPYANGPTGSAGFQNVGEIAGSFALLDTNAMMAMFPGTVYLDQHKGQNHPPFFNQDAILPFDMTKGANSKVTGLDYTDGSNSVHANVPSPVILRFAHAHARYRHDGSTGDATTYMIFGPGQAFPHNTATTEPQGANIVTAGNGYSAVPIYLGGNTAKDSFLPNQLANGDTTEHSGFNRGGALAYLPMTTFFQKNNVQGFNYVMNWQPTKGFPNVNASSSRTYSQTKSMAFFYEGTAGAITGLPKNYHPFSHVFDDISGNAVGSGSHATTRKSSVVWHMDGGYHPGGHFLDDHVRKNPKNHAASAFLSTGSGAKHNTSAFRPAGLLAKAYLTYYGGSPDNQILDDNVVVVDATRCQNAEELGAVLSGAINTFPGKDPLKAIGGTFMPSMQNAHKQDRYGWVELEVNQYTAENSGTPASLRVTSTATTLPDYGWLRVSDGANAGFAPYISQSISAPNTTFTLAKNAITSNTNIVNPQTRSAITPDTSFKAYVWAKAGTHRFNNAASGTGRDHMTQVHFGGFQDAVDRTKPVGAVGWHGEAYSYLNSYEATNDIGANLHPAGLGAWHPFLGFNPYGAAETCVGGSSPASKLTGESAVVSFYEDYCVDGLASRHLVAITHESELPLIAKADKNGVSGMGDWLHVGQTGNIEHAGTVAWDTGKVHNKDRYVGTATAGPHVEAQVHTGFSLPTTSSDYPAVGSAPTDAQLHRTIQSGDMVRANACNYPTGDLFWDESVVKNSAFHEDRGTYGVECIGISDQYDYLDIAATPYKGLYNYYNERSAARNFLPEHVVWKRMDGGSVTMPAVNARGLGMIPWTKRKDNSEYKLVGEKILGNNRFSFETTNAAMFPIIQAQELAHPQLAEQHPLEIRNALLIPNEHIQFQSVSVIDDTGQEHRLEGGSPLGTVIMDFRHISDRDIEGLAPALAGAGVNPNLKIRLPNPDEIPGNIVVRSGFDRLQAYQNETVGSGGLQHPAQASAQLQSMFGNLQPGPRLFPTWENNGWEHLSQDASDISSDTSHSRLKFPASTSEGWADHTDNAPLDSAYEPHDRSLFFHVTRMGVSMTHRYDVDELNYTSYSGTEITVGSTPEAATWTDSNEQSGGRYFLRVYDPATDKGVIASYTGIGTNKFTGVVYSPDFVSFVTGKTGLKVVPSYYMPAGSTRLFAARRLRDHAEYSGASPDMKSIDWFTLYSNLPANTGAMAATSTAYTNLTKPKMTPMPIPRMGHHHVNATMALMPGHYAHPAYQRLYDLNTACQSSNHKSVDTGLIGPLEGTRTSTTSTLQNNGYGRGPLIWFSTPSAPFGPSDIHGGGFTLLTETKVKYEGYGIAASAGSNAGTINSQGGHTLVLEAANTYTLNNHFPDPLEVGAYQIIIQPNVFKQQLQGFHLNHSTENKAPSEGGTKVTELTGQQVNTVIAIEKDMSTRGAYALILAEAMMADVRGCEVILNEVILDIEPDAGSQFTNLAPLALYNPLGVQESTSPSLTRRSLPYRPGMFESSTPGRTLTIPWWGILHKDGATSSSADKFKHLEWHKPDNYYQLCRANYGSVGAQLTLAGYPTSFLDIYEPHKRVRSLNPNCIVISDNDSNTIVVDDNALFPVQPYYGENLVYFKNGIRYTATYTNRTGTLAHATLGESDTFSGVSGTAEFWANLGAGTILRLTTPYDNDDADSLFLSSESSAMTRNLPQLANGSRDTNSLQAADAFLCMWHPNLGRPFTWYSDDNSRGFYANTGVADAPVNQKPYNHVPEHFETVHYHDFNYVASKGPFALGMEWIAPAVDNSYTLSELSSNAVTSAGTDPLVELMISPTKMILTTEPGSGEKLKAYTFDQNSLPDFTATPDELSVNNQSPRGNCFGDGGNSVYIVGQASPYLQRKTLSTPFDITSVSATTTLNIVSFGATQGIAFNDDGSVMYIVTSAGADVKVSTLSTNYDITSSISTSTVSLAVSDDDGDTIEQMTCIRFKPGGTKVFISYYAGSSPKLAEFALSTPFDMTTKSFVSSVNIGTVLGQRIDGGSTVNASIAGFDWNSDGTKLYACSIHTDKDINQVRVAEYVAEASDTGKVYTAAEIDALLDGAGTLSHQGGTLGSNKYNFFGFWGGGSHGGGAVSRLESYGHSLIGWGSDTFGMDCETYQDSTGVATLSLPNDRNRCFGYRMGVRQLYNRPRWSPYVRGWLEVANSNAMLGYYHGPLIQHDSKTNGWDYVGSDSGESDEDIVAMNIGILERITQVSSLLGQDQIGRQVRYSDGRRMTGPFGCPVRTLRNASTTTRMYPNDEAGQGVEELAKAHRHYMVDWWGNTRGEDVRRFPVRGFGLRPSWDPEDAYADTNVTHRPAAHDLFGGDGTDRYSGNTNSDNNNASNMSKVDWFNPASALRVGDRGDGRGVRWPTVFNESLLMAVSEKHDATGLVLSHSTAEPILGQGLVRPSNLALQDGEVERGISDRVDLNADDGLLKSSAHVGEATETVNADDRGAEPVSRNDVRIGLDVDTLAELNDGVSREYVVMSTEAHSLHTDKEVGQRTNIRGAYDVGSRTLKDLDMTALNWSDKPVTGVVKHSNAHAMWALGGTYIMEWSKHAGVLDVKGWGKAGASSSSNPYQDANHDPALENINYADSAIQFVYRPAHGLDHKHSQMFRAFLNTGGPQTGSNFYRATSGGKYGMFTSDVPSARTGTPSSPPYAPVYSVVPTSSTTVPDSQGPKIQGVEVSGYDKADVRSPVARMVMSENTLEHFRSDASRRSTDDEEGDYEVQPRFSQTLHPKGSKGDASYNTGDHSGE